jgi:hypothetical protein
MEKREKKRNSRLTGPRGGILAQRARAGGPADPRRSGVARADAVGVGPHVSESRGVTTWSGRWRGANRSGSTAGEVCGGSSPGAWFCNDGAVARHERG